MRKGKMNYFIEGLQGSGKSTLVERLSDKYKDILEKYSKIREDIEGHTVSEGTHKVVCYTKIITDISGFYKELEQYEIYNGNLELKEFEEIVLSRFLKWDGKNQIFECSIFQNIIENLMLYLELTDEEILGFYKKIAQALSNKDIKILYLNLEDIQAGIEIIKKERSDDAGNELWFPLMIKYLEDAPYSKKHNLKGMEGLISHLERRKALERRIIQEIFDNVTFVLTAKKYDLDLYFNK